MATSTSRSTAARPNTHPKKVRAATQRRRKAKPVPNGSGVAHADGAASSQPRSETKQGRIVALLRQEHGAGLEDLITATGWLPHTTRAALTRLRQGGHAIERLKDEAGRTVYRIAPIARAPRSRGAA